MPPITAVVGDKFQVRVRGTIEGQETNNIFYFGAATPIDDVELRLIVALIECWQTHLLPVMSSAWSLKDVVWKQVNPVLGVEHITIPEGNLQAAGNAAALPSYCSVVVSIRTLLGGKSHRGRFYLPGIPENATNGSGLDPNGAFWAAVLAFAACLAGKFILGDPPAANSFQQLMYSRVLGGSHFPLGNAGFTSIASIKPVQALGTTRSRKVGVGS